MYVVTSMALVRRTRATLRRAEFGFFGVWVYTRMHTPRFSGEPISAGDLVLETIPSLPIRTSCENVGTVDPFGSSKFLVISFSSGSPTYHLELSTNNSLQPAGLKAGHYIPENTWPI